MIATPLPRRNRFFASRIPLAVLLLLVRLAASLLPMPPAPANAAIFTDPLQQALLADEIICHADDQPGGVHDPAAPLDHPAGHAHDCGLCPICLAMAAPALLAAGPPDMPAHAPPPRERLGFRPPSTGPPSLARAATSPRGPPAVSV